MPTIIKQKQIEILDGAGVQQANGQATLSVSDFMRRVKGCTSRKVQQEFPGLRKRYWGKRFWARGYFCTTSGVITNDVILNYIESHQPTDVGSG